MENIKKISIVGSGQMGAGIAQVAASSGFEVAVTDVSQDRLDWGKNYIGSSLARLVRKNKLSQENSETYLNNIKFSLDLNSHCDSDFIIEAASENIELKQEIFKNLDEIAKPSAILASNTSSISMTLIANQTNRPEQVIGMHFMNPVPMMKLVEIIKALQTNQNTYDLTEGLALKLNKQIRM